MQPVKSVSKFLARTTNVIRGDRQARFRLLLVLARWLAPNYRFKWPAMAWWNDETFNAYLDAFEESGGLNTDRRWNLYQLLRLVEGVDGDTAECGVYKGSSSYLICEVSTYAQRARREHFVFDSFEGLSAPDEIDGVYWRQGDLTVAEETARANLIKFENVRFMTGWIPERFEEVANRSFAFVHIDVDLAQPTLDSFGFFYDRLSPGGVIVCDDYGCTTCPGVTAVIDGFLSKRPEKMLALSCGGGFMIKGVRTTTLPSPARADHRASAARGRLPA